MFLNSTQGLPNMGIFNDLFIFLGIVMIISYLWIKSNTKNGNEKENTSGGIE